MKALTICNPYPCLILRVDRRGQPEKPIENREWWTGYRGPLAIHAGKSRAWMNDEDESNYPEMVFGMFVGVAMLADCVKLADLPLRLQGHEHANGPWCWILTDVRALATPFAAGPAPRSHQGLWVPCADDQARLSVTAGTSPYV